MSIKMNVSKLIKMLEEIRNEHGNVPVFTNGEHGYSEIIKCEKNHVSVDEAWVELDRDVPKGIDEHDIVIHIGGY
jgi:hypothetical protein